MTTLSLRLALHCAPLPVVVDVPAVEPNACIVQTFLSDVRQGCQVGLSS
jgi:hypothetical protein